MEIIQTGFPFPHPIMLQYLQAAATQNFTAIQTVFSRGQLLMLDMIMQEPAHLLIQDMIVRYSNNFPMKPGLIVNFLSDLQFIYSLFFRTGLPHLSHESERHGVWLWASGRPISLRMQAFHNLELQVNCYVDIVDFASLILVLLFVWQTCCDCGEYLELCPICRSSIQTRIRLY